jgi:hypothetical protein
MHSHDLSHDPKGHDLTHHEVEHLLEHWVEHNESHSVSFKERAAQVARVSELAAQDINRAAELMDECTEMLKKALKDL